MATSKAATYWATPRARWALSWTPLELVPLPGCHNLESRPFPRPTASGEGELGWQPQQRDCRPALALSGRGQRGAPTGLPVRPH